MKNITKKIIAPSLAAVMTFTSVTANASLQDAVNNFTTKHGGIGTAVDPHTFKTATQRGFHAGSMNIRFPVKAINLVSVERAGVNVGCNGVSITFGGMAFISADEIIEYLKTIAEGVPALIYAMTLQAIAAPLMSALNNLYATMERLSGALKNSCEASQALVGAMGGFSPFGENDPSVGQLGSVFAESLGTWPAGAVKGVDKIVGKSIDKGEKWQKDLKNFFSGKDDGGAKGVSPTKEISVKECLGIATEYGIITGAAGNKETAKCEPGGDFYEISKQVKAIAKHTGIPEDEAAAMMSDKRGNITWNALQLYGIAPYAKAKPATNPISKSVQGNLQFANLMLSMIGGDVIGVDHQAKKLKPTIEAEDAITLFLCGKISAVESVLETSESEFQRKLAKWCLNKYKGKEETELYACTDELNSIPGEACLNPGTIKLKDFEHNFTGGNTGGLLFYVSDILGSSVKKAMAGEAFKEPEKMLMILSPLPIYEVYNVAAATPYVADQLLQNNSLLISYSLLEAMFIELLNSVTQADAGFGKDTIHNILPAKIHQIMFDTQSSIGAAFASEIKYVNYYQQESDNLIANIKSIHRHVLQGSMALGLNGQAFIDGLSELVQ